MLVHQLAQVQGQQSPGEPQTESSRVDLAGSNPTLAPSRCAVRLALRSVYVDLYRSRVEIAIATARRARGAWRARSVDWRPHQRSAASTRAASALRRQSIGRLGAVRRGSRSSPAHLLRTLRAGVARNGLRDCFPFRLTGFSGALLLLTLGLFGARPIRQLGSRRNPRGALRGGYRSAGLSEPRT